MAGTPKRLTPNRDSKLGRHVGQIAVDAAAGEVRHAHGDDRRDLVAPFDNPKNLGIG